MTWPWSARPRPAAGQAEAGAGPPARAPELTALDRLPDAALLLDASGAVRFANAAAATHWSVPAEQLQGRDARALLADLHETGSGKPWTPQLRPPAGLFDDAAGRHLLLRGLPWRDTPDGEPRWLLLLVDITPLRAAQRQCEEALRFLGHDARTPASAILGMIDLTRARRNGPADDDGLLTAIEQQARASLDNADRFVALSRARIRALRLEWLDLHALLQQAVDQAWLAGARRRVRLRLVAPPGEAPVRVDRALLAEAFRQLFAELVTEAAPDSSHECRLFEDVGTGQWCVALPRPAGAAAGASAGAPAGAPSNAPSGAPSGVQSAASRLLTVAMQRHGASLRCEPPGAGAGPCGRWLLRLPNAA